MVKLAYITLYKSGPSTSGDLPGLYTDPEAALPDALAYARQMVGPERAGYRPPNIAVVRNPDTLDPPIVKVGNTDADPSYTVIYSYQP